MLKILGQEYFLDLDEITNGLIPGNLIIIASRPAVGKTAFSLNLLTL